MMIILIMVYTIDSIYCTYIHFRISKYQIFLLKPKNMTSYDFFTYLTLVNIMDYIAKIGVPIWKSDKLYGKVMTFLSPFSKYNFLCLNYDTVDTIS